MKERVKIIFISILWSILLLLFPVISATLSTILSLKNEETLFLQGFFMVLSLIPILFFVRKKRLSEVKIKKPKNSKKLLYYLPFILIFIPVIINGFYIKSIFYVLGNLFLYLFVGIAEEIYYRSIIPSYLKKVFSIKQIILISTIIFGISHIVTIMSGNGIFEMILTVINAFIFGLLAILLVFVSDSIIPSIIIHFLFDFETKIVLMNDSYLLIAEIIRGIIMFVLCIWLFTLVFKKDKQLLIKGGEY